MRMPRWGGGFGTRLFLFTASVAVVAAGAAAFLTVRQVSRQVTESVEVAEHDVDNIVRGLADTAVPAVGWNESRLRTTVAKLAAKTGQRIRVSFDDVVIDSDTLDGGEPRPLSTRPDLTVDPLPVPDYTGVEAHDRFDYTTTAALDFIALSVIAPCMTAHGHETTWTRGLLGLPTIELWRVWDDIAPDCGMQQSLTSGASPPRVVPGTTEEMVTSLLTEYLECDPDPNQSPKTTGEGAESRPDDIPCLQRAFRAQIVELDVASPLTLSIGIGGEPRAAPIDLWPALIAAAIVALIAIFGTALMSRRVLRPVVKLTAAARQLGDGDLAERVPVRGRDQIAELATSFNRMAASLQASKEQQRTMVGDIAHELRTPLANIRGYLEALKDGVLAPDPALFQSLHEEAVLQQRLIDDLQELAEAESGAMIYHRARLDVADLLSTSRTAHLAAAEARGVRLAMTVHGDPVIHGDADRLRQVIGNLVTNALRATPAGGTVTLRTQAQPDAVYVAVADTGHGIAEDDLPHVFDRFWRADNARSRSTGGSGLGLAIAREIVAAHQGSITVTSTTGKGTVFTMRFPLA